MERLSTWSKSLTGSKPLFVFDLDSTITKCELLPLIAESVGLGDEMAKMTEMAMCSSIPFEADFRRRVELLGRIPVSKARTIIVSAPLNREIVSFLRENPSRCCIMTGNLDIWIQDLIERIGMLGRCFSSHAAVEQDRITGITSVLDKSQISRNLPSPFIAIGDGNNDIGMLKTASIGVAFGGVRALSDEVIRAADKVFTDESELVAYLRCFL
ncbi:MAG: HAD family phosphatase [Merdibacter sp.]|mgnify:FL=1|nr:HAD family phosphatase [Merdibacter sp.]